jgi:RHS repeat-associated protein
VERYQYDPYGRRQIFVDDEDSSGLAWGQQVLASTVGSRLGHKGRWHEPATGLIENRARTNNPRIGRWMQRDPGARASRVISGVHLAYRDGLNLYQDMRGNPIRFADPRGLCTKPQNKNVPCCDGSGGCMACLSVEMEARTDPVRSCAADHELVHCDQFVGSGQYTCSSCGRYCQPGGRAGCCPDWTTAGDSGTPGTQGGPADPSDPTVDQAFRDLECAAHNVHLQCILDAQTECGCSEGEPGVGSPECDDLEAAEAHVFDLQQLWCSPPTP